MDRRVEKPKTQALVVFCASLFQFEVFRRWRPALAACGWSLTVVTNRFSVWLSSLVRRIPCEIMRPTTAAVVDLDLSPETTPEFIQNSISLRAAREFQHSLWTALQNIFARYDVRAACQWNGLTVDGQTLTVFARKHKLPLVFIELGNIVRGLFIDPEGVLAGSRIAKHPELLDSLVVNDEEISNWREDHLKERRSTSVPPQARQVRRWNLWSLVDLFGAIVLRIPRQRQISLMQKIISKLRVSLRQAPPAIKPTRPYVLFPLQVSSDVNLVLFSKHNNLTALAIAERYAGERGLLLVVKPHPAETDFEQQEAIRKRCASRGHLLTSYDTTQLVLGSERVITINSTVGLEALLLDVPVTILGRAIYASFSKRRAYAFVLHHLLNFEAFGTEVASADVIGRILGIIEAQRHHTNAERATVANEFEPVRL